MDADINKVGALGALPSKTIDLKVKVAHIAVLDKGHVELITYMGSDLTVVNAARVSYDKESDWEYADDRPMLSEKDIRLINYLATHGHWTPFGQPQIQLRIKMPIFVARQWRTSNVGFTRNEVSRRYVDSDPEYYIPSEWRSRPHKSKQGSGDEPILEQGQARYDFSKAITEADARYKSLLKLGVAPEQARIVLPQTTYTEFYETGSLAAYARICSLRDSDEAQWEIQQYAKAVSQIVSEKFPVSWAALTKERVVTVPAINDAEAIDDIERILQRVRQQKYTEARKHDGIDNGIYEAKSKAFGYV